MAGSYPTVSAAGARERVAREGREVLTHPGLTDQQKALYTATLQTRQQEADIDAVVEVFQNEGVDFTAIRRSRGAGAGADPRNLKVFCPPFELANQQEEGLAKLEAAQRFMVEYATGGAAERKPHLDRIFDEIAEGVPVPSDDVFLDATRRVEDKELFAFDNKFVYLEGVMAENPGYTAERFNSPQKLERLNASRMYIGPHLQMQQAYLMSNNMKLNTFADNLETIESNTRTGRNMIPEAVSIATAAAQVYRNKIAMLDGKALPHNSIDFNLQGDASGQFNNAEIFGLKENLASRRARSDAPGVRAAKAHFDTKMGAIFDDTQTKRLKERNLSMFDMIYINGVSAAELYGDKYNNMSRQSRSAMIKAEIISAMVNDKAKIDVTPIMIDKDGREKVTPLSIKPSVKEIQPTLNPFKRFVNGLCSPFGKPFKTEEEKLVIANDTPGHDKDLRLAEAIRPVQEKVTRAAVESLNRQLDELKRNPTPYLQISRDFDKGFNRERTSLCKALYGEQYENTAHLGDTTHVRLERGGVNIGAAMLFANGHSFDDILDPDKLKDEKREAGKQLVELLRLGKSDDPEKQKKSKEGIADVYLRYAERYSKLDMLPIDHTDPAQLAANRRELIGRGLIACDISQEIAQVKDTVIGLTGKSRYDKLGDAMAYNGMLYNTLESSVRNAAAALDAPAEATRIKAAQESAKGIYMRDKIGLLFNGNKDAKVGDINGFNTARETYNFVAFLGASGEMGDSSVQNGNFHKIVMNLCHNRNVMVVDGAKNTLRSDFESGVSLTAPELGAAQNREAVRYDDLDQRQHTTSRERVAASPQLQMNTPQM